MNILRTYMIGVMLRSVATVIGVIISISAIVQLVGQLDDIGTASYGLPEALNYIALGIPRLVVQALPAATLLGALIGLGQLSTQSELIAMRAAGVSKRGMLGVLLLAGSMLVLVQSGLGESIAPSLGAYARDMRTAAMLEEDVLGNSQSTWLRDGDRIISVRRTSGAFSFDSGVYVYGLTETGLDSVGHAVSVIQSDDAAWSLSDYGETRFSPAGVTTSRFEVLEQPLGVSTELFQLSVVREDLLDTPGLRRYIEFLRSNHLDDRRYQMAFWGRWADRVSVLLMALLALPFVSGSLRDAGAGARMVVGLVVGLGFFVADDVLASSVTVYDLNPVIVAWLPTAGLALATLIALLRMR